jgi:hypothetical protein
MSRRHSARNLASLGEFADWKVTLQQHLQHPKAVRVRKGAQAFSRLVKRLKVGQSNCQ